MKKGVVCGWIGAIKKSLGLGWVGANYGKPMPRVSPENANYGRNHANSLSLYIFIAHCTFSLQIVALKNEIGRKNAKY